MRSFSELELDALTEAFNLSLGEAAATFSAIVREEIDLSVPVVEFVARDELTRRMRDEQPPGSRHLCRINQHFETSGDGFRTDAMLLFPEAGSLEVVRRMLGDDTPVQHITELEQDALAEVGNIIINSCMSSLADLFGTEMIGSLPRVQCVEVSHLLDDKSPDNLILVARIGMRMSAHNLSGFVLFLMDVPAIDHFMRRVCQVFNLPKPTTPENR